MTDSAVGSLKMQLDAAKIQLANATVDAVIVEVVLPMAYNIIDQLIDLDGKPIPKKLLADAKRLLPSKYKNSFQFKGEA